MHIEAPLWMARSRAIVRVLMCATPLVLGGAPDCTLPRSSGEIAAATIFADEEECLYEVRWTFIKLGTIRIKTLGGRRAEAYIDSYDGLPFVNLHSYATCVMDSLLYCGDSRSADKQGDEWRGLVYHPDTAALAVYVDETSHADPHAVPSSRSPKDTIKLKQPQFVDGLSIGYFPRRFIHTSQTVSVPTIFYGKLGITFFHFDNSIEEEDIDGLDRPVRTVAVKGHTDVEGIFGLNGDFEGWFSDDSLGVPIKGKLKVLLGSVTLELVEWHRKGWSPPTL